MISKKFKKSLIVILASFLVLALSLFCVNFTLAKAEDTSQKLSITMDKGALIRLKDGEKNSGLRFRATLTNYGADGENYDYGMIIVPSDYLIKNNISGNYLSELDKLKEQGTISTYINAEVLPVQMGERWIIQHSIVNINDYNYDRDFVGIGYAINKTTNEYTYASLNDNYRSITYIASYALNEFNLNKDDIDNVEVYENNIDALEEYVMQGIENVTSTFNPEISGVSNVNAGDACELSLENTSNIKLDWRWNSSEQNIAMISSSGYLEALSTGDATITASCGVEAYQREFSVKVFGKQFDFGAFWGKGTTGRFWELDENGKVIVTEEADNAAIAKLKEYKEAGLEVYMPGASASYAAANAKFEGSAIERVLNFCAREDIGLKVLVQDGTLSYYIKEADGKTAFENLFGVGDSYDENKLVEWLQKKSTMPYAHHSAFYGFDLCDEPRESEHDIDILGKIYRALRKAYPNAYVHVCLLPEAYVGSTQDENQAYYDTMLAMGLENLTFDQYPMMANLISPAYISRMKWRADICKERKIDLKVATQTYKSNDGMRNLDEDDFYWLNNMLLGFGVKNVYYYTYLTEDGHADFDGYTFINNSGEKTDTYNSMQKIMKEMQLIAPMALQFDYNNAVMIKGNTGEGMHRHYEEGFDGGNSATLNKLSASVDNEGALVTELKRGADDYMYMVQNVTDPDCTCSSASNQNVTITFASDVKEFIMFKDGSYQKVTLNGSTYTLNLRAGRAAYIFLTKPNVISLGSSDVNIGDLVGNNNSPAWGI